MGQDVLSMKTDSSALLRGAPLRSGDPVLEVARYLPRALAQILSGLPVAVTNQLEEVRLRAGRPLILQGSSREWSLTQTGLSDDISPLDALTASPELMAQVLETVSQGSVYALEEEMRNGFITLPGGHRVGLCGRAVVADGEIKTLSDLAGINIRIAREIKGAADGVISSIVDRQNQVVYNTLILSPPGCGKTTLLRDTARQISTGNSQMGLPGLKVGIVDERSELAGLRHGTPQHDIGPRTDVIDGCPKSQGMMLLLRTMSPQVVVTDELGRADDVAAVVECSLAGVSVLASAHAASLRDVAQRKTMAPLLERQGFSRFIILSRRKGPGTVEAVLDENGKGLL